MRTKTCARDKKDCVHSAVPINSGVYFLVDYEGHIESILFDGVQRTYVEHILPHRNIYGARCTPIRKVSVQSIDPNNRLHPLPHEVYGASRAQTPLHPAQSEYIERTLACGISYMEKTEC